MINIIQTYQLVKNINRSTNLDAKFLLITITIVVNPLIEPIITKFTWKINWPTTKRKIQIGSI